MDIPEQINRHWIDGLDNDQLLTAEAELHVVFRTEEKSEKARMGPRYALLLGSTTLVNAWQRWTRLSNEARNRGIMNRRRA